MDKKAVGLSIVSLTAAATLFGASPAKADLVDCTKICEPGTPGIFLKVEALTDVLYKLAPVDNQFLKWNTAFLKIEDVFYKLGVQPIRGETPVVTDLG